MITFDQLILKSDNYKHHAFLLISKQFEKKDLQQEQLRIFARQFCQIHLYEDNQTDGFEVASYHPDIFIAPRDKKTLVISDLEKIKELALYPPVEGSKRLFIIERCERMNANAANALLKILEEPFSSALFLMTCTHLNSVLPTIASRAQRIFIQISDDPKTDVRSMFSEKDMLWISKQIENFNLNSLSSFQSLHEKKLKQINPTTLKEILIFCESLAKEYEADAIRDLIVFLVSERVKKQAEFLQTAKCVLTTLSQWKEAEPLHPSSLFWLTRLFLSFS